MTTITLPPEVEERIVHEARKQGITPEVLAVDCLRKHFVPAPTEPGAPQGGTLREFLAGYVGTVEGSSEPLSENCGQRFTEGLVEKQKQGRL
jgi:hypothetical protein